MFGFLAFIFVIAIYLLLDGRLKRLEKLEKQRLKSAISEPGFDKLSASLGSGVPMPVPQPAGLSSVQAIPESPQVSRDENLFSKDLGRLTAFHYLTGIGSVALLFGVGFFLKYAIDQGWVSPLARVLMGASVGTLLIVLGEMLWKKISQYAQWLVGLGLAVLYFSGFAAYGYYQLISAFSAFCVLILVSGLTLVLGFYRSSRVLNFLAVLGAYLASMFIPFTEKQQFNMMVYLSLVNVSVVLLLLKDYSFEKLSLLLLANSIIYANWHQFSFNSENPLLTTGYLLVNYILVVIGMVPVMLKLYENKKHSENTGLFLGIQLIGATFLVSALLYNVLNKIYAETLPLAPMLMAMVVFVAYAFVRHLLDEKLNVLLVLVGTYLVALGMYWHFTDRPLLLAWLVVIMILGLVGKIIRFQEFHLVGLFYLVLLVPWVVVSQSLPTDLFILNTKFFLEMGTALLFLFWFIFMKLPEHFISLKNFTVLTLGFAISLLWLAVSAEILTNFRAIDSANLRNLLLSLWWMVYSVILGVFSLKYPHLVIRQLAGAFLLFAIVKVFIYDVSFLQTGYRIVSFIALGVLLLAGGYFYQSHKEKIKQILLSQDSSN